MSDLRRIRGQASLVVTLLLTAPLLGGQQAPKPAAQQAAPAQRPPAHQAPAAQAAAAEAANQAKAARLQRALTPGEPHQQLAKLAGNWRTQSRSMLEPGSPPIDGVGTSEVKVVMDGRFVVETHASMSGMGPYKGLGVYGYDNVTQRYQGTWVDTLGTGMLTLEGKADATGQLIEWTVAASDPLLNERKSIRAVTRHESDSRYTFTLIDKVKDEEFIRLRITYTRQ